MSFLSEPFRPCNEKSSSEYPGCDTSGWSDPLVFECELEIPRDSDQDGQDADPIEKMGADSCFD